MAIDCDACDGCCALATLERSRTTLRANVTLGQTVAMSTTVHAQALNDTNDAFWPHNGSLQLKVESKPYFVVA